MTMMALGQTARFINGAAFKPTDWGDNGLPIIRIQNLTGTGEKFNFTTRQVKAELVVEPGDLLVSWSATLDVYRWAGPRGLLNQHIFKVLPKPGIDPDYLFFALKSALAELSSKTHGSTMKHVVRGDFESTQIRVPPLDEQCRIVDILSRAEGIVRLRREAQRKAAELVPGIFLDMFGDPATNPKGWPVATLGEVVEEFRYGTSQKSGPTGFPVLRIPNVVGDRLEPSPMKFVEVQEAEVNRLQLLDGDFLFVRTNGNPDYVGRSAVFESEVMRQAGFNGTNTLYASYLIRARIQRSRLEPYFLQGYLSSTEGRRKRKERSRTSAGQFNINIDGLSSIPVPLPPLALQLDFVQHCRDIFGIQFQQTAATAKAEAAFSALLGQAFSAN